MFFSLISAQPNQSAPQGKDTVQTKISKNDMNSLSTVKDTVVKDSAVSADTAKYYSLTIETVPDSVVVVLGDTVAGISPFTLSELKSGEYTFVLKKKGFYQKKVTTIIDSSSAKVLKLVLQQPGTVFVNSDPAGADVTFNGDKKGLTPLTVSPVKPGDYTIQLKKDTFNIFQRSITVLSGETDTVFCKMVKDTAMINSSRLVQQKEKSKKSRVTSIVLAAAFCLFAGIVTIIDFSGNR
jgi:hypothetical protein